MTKPDGTTHREFYINGGWARPENNFGQYDKGEVIHTIEISAYQEAIAERDSLKEQCDNWYEKSCQDFEAVQKWRKMATDLYDRLILNRHHCRQCPQCDLRTEEYVKQYEAMLGDKP